MFAPSGISVRRRRKPFSGGLAARGFAASLGLPAEGGNPRRTGDTTHFLNPLASMVISGAYLRLSLEVNRFASPAIQDTQKS